MRAPWDLVKCRVSWGDMPEPGDVLQFNSGRRLQVLKIGGTKTLHCLVLPVDHEVEPGTRVLPWCWAPRKRKAKLR